jgi:ectoine hydroxylase-related dioxygenase (phytanoyl-CoA dioxygenase family)
VVRLQGALKDRFDRDGYVVAPGLLGADEVARYGAAVDAAVAVRTAGDERTLAEKTRYEQSFQQCINLWEDCPDVRPLTFHPAVAAAAAELLGVDSVRLWHDQALYKEAGGRGTDPHQDHPYWPIAEVATITAWIPLMDVAEDSGAMGYVPGSHRFGVRQFADIFQGEGFDLAAGPEARGVAPVFVAVRAGDVAFHHGLTIHLAGANGSGTTRRAHTAIFFADGSTRAERPRRHPSVDRGAVPVGDPIASAFTPVAHPRPAGDLPPAPPPPEPRLRGWPGWTWADGGAPPIQRDG